MEMGFIGLGGMGEPMARSLMKGGPRVNCSQSHPQPRGGVGRRGCNVCGNTGRGMYGWSGGHDVG